MSDFSNSEKAEIVRFVANNRLNSNRLSENMQSKWEELGKKLNRDWKSIYNLYKQWKIDDHELVLKSEPDEAVADEPETSSAQETNTAQISTLDLLPAPSHEIENNEEILQYVTLDGQMVNLDDYDQFILCDTNTLAEINNQVEQAASGKRKLDLNDFDTALLNTLEEHGREELEMQREEHDKKMKILKMQLEHGEEIHVEKMKILKTKLRAVQQQIHHIDHVICNRRLKRKFKSGPI